MKTLFALLLTFISSAALACPELEGVDLASENQERDLIVLSGNAVRLDLQTFNRYFESVGLNYELCKDAIWKEVVVHKRTRRAFLIYHSSADRCDGGNAFGAVIDIVTNKRLGTIGDSQVSCH